jgi:hypothetical protein
MTFLSVSETRSAFQLQSSMVHLEDFDAFLKSFL